MNKFIHIGFVEAVIELKRCKATHSKETELIRETQFCAEN